METSKLFEINKNGNLVFLFDNKELLVNGVAVLNNDYFFVGTGNDKRD